MTKEELVKGMAYLGIALDRKFTDEECKVYYDFLKGYDYKTYVQAVKNIILNGEKKASVALIVNEIKKLTIPDLQYNAEEEWEQVIEVIRRYGYYDFEKAMKQLKPLTKECVRAIGWERLCMSESIQWERKLFLEIFENKQYAIEHDPMMLGYQYRTETKLIGDGNQ